MRALKKHRHLGIHTGMFNDALMELVRGGAVDHSAKNYLPGKIIASHVLGRKLFVASRVPFISFGKRSASCTPAASSSVTGLMPTMEKLPCTGPNGAAGCAAVAPSVRGQAQLAADPLVGASPRGWEDVSNVLKSRLSEDARRVFVQGRIGAANAAEFFGVLRELQAGADVLLMPPDIAAVSSSQVARRTAQRSPLSSVSSCRASASMYE